MAVEICVEHQVIGDKWVLEDFENVKDVKSPPMTNEIHIEFADERDKKKLRHGQITSVECQEKQKQKS